MQLTDINLDVAVHAIEALSILGLGGYVRRLTRLVTLLRDFPPHRHDNGRILYPYDYPPSPIGKMNGEAKP